MGTFSVKEFSQRLQEHEQISGLVKMVLMAKSLEEGDGWAVSYDCEKWIEIPEDIVESAEIIGSSACSDHNHPLVEVTFRAPQKGYGHVYYELLNLSLQLKNAPCGERHQGDRHPGASSGFLPEANETNSFGMLQLGVGLSDAQARQAGLWPIPCSLGHVSSANGWAWACCGGTWYQLGLNDSRGNWVHYRCSQARNSQFSCNGAIRGYSC